MKMALMSLWNCLGRMRKCGLVGGSVSLGTDFEVSKALTISALSPVLVHPDGSSQLLLQHHVCLPAVALCHFMVMDTDL